MCDTIWVMVGCQNVQNKSFVNWAPFVNGCCCMPFNWIQLFTRLEVWTKIILDGFSNNALAKLATIYLSCTVIAQSLHAIIQNNDTIEKIKSNLIFNLRKINAQTALWFFSHLQKGNENELAKKQQKSHVFFLIIIGTVVRIGYMLKKN